MKRKILILSFVLCRLFTNAVHAQAPAITPDELSMLAGQWSGTLTYLDYRTGKPYTMPANARIIYDDKNKMLVFYNTYPNEPKANRSDTVIISADGRMLDNETIQSKTVLPGGNIQLVTVRTGVDGNDNKPALVQYTYRLGKNFFSKRKDVKFEGENDWITRHEFSYTKKDESQR